MFKRSIVDSSQPFINKNIHQIKNDKNQTFYLDNVSSINVLKDFFLSQAMMNMTQSQPLWSMPWTQPFQTSESKFANTTMDLVSLLGPLSQSRTLPSRIAKDWKVNKTVQESLIHYGIYFLKNKQIKANENQNIFIHCKKVNLWQNEMFHFFESLIKTQSPLLRSETWYEQRSLIYTLDLFTKNVPFKIRILPKQIALKANQLYENEKYWYSHFKISQLYKKSYPKIEIHPYSLSTKTEKNFQYFDQPSSKQTNPFFFFIKKNLEDSLCQLNQMLFVQKLNLRKIQDFPKKNRLSKPTQQVILKDNFLLLKKKQSDIKKTLKQIWPELGDSKNYFLTKTTQDWYINNQALITNIPKSFKDFQNDKKNKETLISIKNNVKTSNNQYKIRQIKKYTNFRYSREKRKSINEFQNKYSIRYVKKNLWIEKVNSDKTKSKTQWTKKFYKHFTNESKNLNSQFFHEWKECFLKKKTFHCFQKKSQKPWIDQQILLRFSNLFYTILSLRDRAYSSSIFTPLFQLISFDLWWALFVSCGVGLVIQYQEENTLRQELHGAVSLSPLSIWHLYWKQKPGHSFWPQVVNSLQLRANSWAQPRFLQFQNLCHIGISPLVILFIKPRVINWMSFEVVRVIVNIAESIENIAELVYDRVTLVSINLHTKTNSILVKQLDQAHHWSRRVEPSCDDVLKAVLKNPIAQLTLFLGRYLFYNVIWWTLIPLRFIGFLNSLGWRIWHIVPVSIKRYLEKRGNERRFRWTLERAINHKGMLAGAQHTLDHPGGGTFVAKRIRIMNLFLRMSNICDAELSSIAGIDTRYDASIRDTVVPKSSLFIEPIGSRRDEWFQLASDHWRVPVIQLKLDWSCERDQMSMSGQTVSINWRFGKSLVEKNLFAQEKNLSSTGSAGQTSSVSSTGSTNNGNGPGPLFQITREDEILSDGTIAPSMDRPETIAEDYMVRHFMLAAATIPCLFVVEGLNTFYNTEHSYSYLAVRELRERSSTGGLSYEEKMFGFLPNNGYLTVDYWDILGKPDYLDKETEEEDNEIEELEDDPPEIREAKLALKANLGPQDIRAWVALPPEGGITGWETMKLLDRYYWNPPAALVYLLWLLDKFPRTRYGIRFGVGTFLTIKEPLLRKRRWRKVYIMKGLNWVDRERIFQALMMSTGTFRLKDQMLQQVLPRSQGYTLAEMHSFVNEIALCKAQASLHLQWGKEWGWDDALFVRKKNKYHKPASASDAASNFFMWKRASYLQDLHQITPTWTCIEKALRSLMREEQASMTRFSPYYFFRDGRAHIYRHLSKWVLSAFLFPGVTRFPVYNVGEVRFRYIYLERFAFGEPSYPIGYRRDPTATATWSEIIRSLALIAGGDLYYKCIENNSEQPTFKSQLFINCIGISRQLKQMDKPIIDICWQLLWALAKQNPLAPFTNPLYSFKKRSLKSVYKNKSYGNRVLSNGIGIVQAREENTLSFYKSLPLILFRFPGLDEEDPLGGKEPFVHTASLYPYCGWRRKKRYYDEPRPITMPHPSLQVMVKDEELLHLNYVWERFSFYIYYKQSPHSVQQEEQINPDEYGRPLEVAELREVQDKKAGASVLIQSGGCPLKDAPTDLELREFTTSPFPSTNNVNLRIFSEEPDRVWHLDKSLLKDISLDDLHFLHAWIPFFQWIYKEEKVDPSCNKVWVAPYRRLHVLVTYVDSYGVNDLSPIHNRLFGLDPTDSNQQKSWEIQRRELTDNIWKADNKIVDQMWINLAPNRKVVKNSRPMLKEHKEHMEFLTMSQFIRSREHRRKIRMKERTRKVLSKTFDRANPHTGSIEDPAALAAEPLSLTAAQRAEIATSGMLMSAHECGPLWRTYHAVTTGMHRGWDLTYSTSDLRWLLFNETDRSESELYTTFYEIQKMITWLIVWIWPNLQNVFFLMQSRAVWAQEETQKSNWRLVKLSYSANLERGQTIARLETEEEELTAIIWNSSASNSIIQSLPGSLFLSLKLFKNKISNDIDKKTGQINPFLQVSKSEGILTYKKPGWRGAELLYCFKLFK